MKTKFSNEYEFYEVFLDPHLQIDLILDLKSGVVRRPMLPSSNTRNFAVANNLETVARRFYVIETQVDRNNDYFLQLHF